MRRLVCLLVAAFMLSCLAGCFTMDSDHREHHWNIMLKDFKEWHSDLDFMLGLDEPTLLESNYR